MRGVVFFLCLIWLLAGCATSGPLLRERSHTGLPSEGKTFGGTLLDADGDGRLDLFLSRHTRTPEVYLNAGRLRFRKCRPATGEWPELVDQHGSAALDYDGDGHSDVYVTVGAGRGTTEGINGMWRAVGRCAYAQEPDLPRFVTDPRGRGRGALWLDLAADGLLDLLVFNEESPARLYTLGHDGWTDRTRELPPYPAGQRRTTRRSPKGDRAPRYPLHTACAGDLDDDGRPELFVGGTKNLLLSTDRRGRVQDVSDVAGLDAGNGFVADAALADLDSDGDLDLVVAYEGDAGIRTWINASEGGRLRLEPGPSIELGPLRPWSIQVADFDNDGLVDLYVARLGPGQSNLPNKIARGEGGGRFSWPPDWGGAADVFGGSTGAWAADFDHDGDLDLMALQGAGPSPTQPGGVILYENRARHRGITVELQSGWGPPHGLGAKATLRGASREQTAWAVSEASPWNSMVPRLHFGVGDEEGPFELLVRWPGGETQTVILPRSRAAYRVGRDRPQPVRLR